MTDIQHAPADYYAEPLFEIESDQDPVHSTAEHSDAYKHLVEQRDAARRRHRSGTRAMIGRHALRAILNHQLTDAEVKDLFPLPEDQPVREPEVLLDERPPRDLDWAERAAGEGVRHTHDEDTPS